MWRQLQLKRKIQKPVDNNSGLAKLLQEKVDEYLVSLVNNEGEIEKIVNELSKRNLTNSQLSTVNNSFSSYSKAAKGLTDYIKEL